MKKVTIFVDESGTLPDPKDRVVVVAAVGASFPERIESTIEAVRKSGKFRKEIGEVKFYTSGDKSKMLFLEKVVEEDFVGEKLPPVKHVNSKEDKKVNVADMVAGAVLAKEAGKGDRFYKIIKEQIISETRINWPEAKRKLFLR